MICGMIEGQIEDVVDVVMTTRKRATRRRGDDVRMRVRGRDMRGRSMSFRLG